MAMSMRNGADVDESLFGNTLPKGQRTKGGSNRTNLLIVGKDTVQVVRPQRNANAPAVSNLLIMNIIYNRQLKSLLSVTILTLLYLQFQSNTFSSPISRPPSVLLPSSALPS